MHRLSDDREPAATAAAAAARGGDERVAQAALGGHIVSYKIYGKSGWESGWRPTTIGADGRAWAFGSYCRVNLPE